MWIAAYIGDGYSTPAVVGARLYLLSNRGMEYESVQARSIEDGKPVWSARLGNVGAPNQEPPYPMARSADLAETVKLVEELDQAFVDRAKTELGRVDFLLTAARADQQPLHLGGAGGLPCSSHCCNKACQTTRAMPRK